MAYTKEVTEDGSFIISAGSNPLTVVIQQANPLHQWVTFMNNISILANDEYTVPYIVDGIYNVHVTELGSTTSFYHVNYSIIKQHLTTKILNVVNYPERIKAMNYDKYDFTALFLLGIRFIGGDDFTSHGISSDQLFIPAILRPTNSAILSSEKYLSSFTEFCKP